MNNIESIKSAIAKKTEENAELARMNFKDAGTLTEDEVEQLNQMREEKHLSVIEEDANGRKTESTVEVFVQELDDRTLNIKNDTSSVKLMDGMDLPNVEELHAKVTNGVKEKALAAVSAISANDLTADDFDRLSTAAMDGLKMMFQTEHLDADKVTKGLMKMPLSYIRQYIPDEIVNTFCSEEDLKYNQTRAKDQLVTSLAYLVVTGPELDDLNDYIDHEHKKMSVMTRLAQCGVDFNQVLSSKETLAEIVEASKKLRSDKAMSYSEIIARPDAVTMFFSQYAIVADRMADAYAELLKEFPDEEDRALINEEVDINRKKAEVYRSIDKLEAFEERFNIYVTSTKTDKRFSRSYLEKQAIDVVDRVRSAKVSVMFPGFTGKESNNKEIYLNYTALIAGSESRNIKGVVAEYNDAIKILDSANKDVSDLVPITHDPKLFSDVVLIVFGRLTKHLTRNVATKYDAILLDSYFMLLCQMSSDIFILNRIYKMIRPFLDYVMTLPEKKAK